MSSEDMKTLKRIRSDAYARIKNREQSGFRDCCKVFKFNLEIETKDFNNLVNDLEITHLLMDENFNLSKMLERDINSFVKIGTNMILGIIGNVGSGKSELAMLILLMCMQANRDQNRDVDYHLCWEMKDVLNVFPVLNEGDIVWKDEMPKTTRKGSNTQEWEVNNVLRVVRAFQNTFIFVDPLDIKVDICNLYFESAGMNKKERTNRFLVLNKYRKYIGHICVKLHDNEKFRNYYLKEKQKFIKKSLKDKGFSKSGIIIDAKLEKDKTDKEKDKMIDILVQILKDTIRDTKKNKARNIFIWEHHMKDKEKYSFKELADTFELSPDTIEFVFYNLNKKINKYPLVKKINLKFF